ncbi:amidoligase family protein [Azospirillum sp. ST 5-10]|uniref:amidoligase family protein n=1 Tax=unclassified Azospirillum TaxID=2630922 RepID=UPI003F4A7FE9
MSACPAAVLPDPYATPPRLHTADGAPRRVGLELEFMGVATARAAQALAAALGGRVVGEDPHAYAVLDSALGDLAVELDLRHAHPQRHAGALRWRLGRRGAGLLGTLARRVVPQELITRPLPLDRLHEFERAVAVLAGAGARTTRLPLVEVPGLHFNVDVPSCEAAALTAHLRAFVLLEPWLRRAALDAFGGATRARASLPARHPAAYVDRLLDPAYRPDAATFVDDYLDANPSRDRGLDLLPLLLHLEPERVRARLPREKISARPAFHYRLPLARVGEPGWSPAADWNRWVLVERLAADGDRLAELARRRRAAGGGDDGWADALVRAGVVPPPG